VRSVGDVDYSSITLDVADGVARLTLDRPQAANAVDRAMASELRDAALRLAHDPSVRVVVLAANGKVFCGGGDLSDFATRTPAEVGVHLEHVALDLHAAQNRLARLDAPVIAAVTGACGGAGMSLVASCDLVVAGESSRFTMAYTKVGLSPDGTSSYFLARVVGLRRAMELVLTNRVLSAAEALSWGLVNEVVPDAEVLARASALAAQLAAGPALAHGAAKRLLLEGASASLEATMDAEVRSIAALAGTADGQEGIAAFLGKRAPRFGAR
jgi:2-(1,2-epoxy-1,2-dihydrophenyl)acetyl-CoA isomerase